MRELFGFGRGKKKQSQCLITEPVGTYEKDSLNKRPSLREPAAAGSSEDVEVNDLPYTRSGQAPFLGRIQLPRFSLLRNILNQGDRKNPGGASAATLCSGSVINVHQRAEQHDLEAYITTIPHSPDASYDVIHNATRGPCTPGTRTNILGQLTKWCKSTSVPLFWINGFPGTGKTTISYTMCEKLKKERQLGASFFCSRSLPDCRDVNSILPTIAYQLAQKYPPFKQALAKALQQNKDIWKKCLDVQMRILIVEPWRKKRWRLPRNAIVVLDGLDECEAGHSIFLNILIAHATRLPFKMLITSRPNLILRDAPKPRSRTILSTLVLHEVQDILVQTDIVKHLEHKLGNRVPPDVIKSLKELSGCLFLTAATLARMSLAENVDAREQLETFKNPSTTQRQVLSTVDELYRAVLGPILGLQEEGDLIGREDRQETQEAEVQGIKDILLTVAYARAPLTLRGIANLWNITDEEVERRLDPLRSVLSVPHSHTQPIMVFHTSLTDFMEQPSCSGQFHCSPGNFHLGTLKRCLALMERELHPNLCQLEGRPPNDSINIEVIDKHISSSLRYASTYWSVHWKLANRSGRHTVLSSIRDLLSRNALCWFECLSLIGRLSASTENLEMFLNGSDEDPELASIVYSSLRFIQHVYDLIKYSAMEIYHSALTWIPLYSPLRTHYAALCEQAPQALYGLATTWTGPDRTIDIHAENVTSTAISQNGDLLVSGSYDCTMRLWNIHSHTEEYVFSGHRHPVCSVAISGDGSCAISGCLDGTVWIWNIATHKAVFILETPSPALAVGMSSDNQWIASGHRDGHIRIWGTTTGRLIYCLQGHRSDVPSLSFVPDSTRLVSASYDNTARLWDMTTGKVECVLYGHTSKVISVASSPSGDGIATASHDRTARLWDMSGRELHILRASSGSILSVDFTRNGKLIVTGSDMGSLRIWDAASGNIIHEFTGLADIIRSATIFPDKRKMATNAGNTTSLWSLRGKPFTSGGERNAHHAIIDTPRSMVFSSNGRRVLFLPSLCILDTTTLERMTTLVPVGVEHRCGAWSTSGSKVAAALYNTTEVWELTKDDVVVNYFAFKGHTHNINSISFSFSEDQHQLASASSDLTARVWNVTTQKQIHVLRHPNPVLDIAFSHDHTQIISAAYSTVHIWNAESGEQSHQFDATVSRLAFSPNSKYIITFGPDTVTIYHSKTYKLEQTYEGYNYWTMTDRGSFYALSKDGWVCHSSRSGDRPRRLVWIPPQYRPGYSSGELLNQKTLVFGPLFSFSSRGVQVCLPKNNNLITLLIPHNH